MKPLIKSELEGFTAYYKSKRQLMKPWTPDLDMSKVSVAEGETPEIGGMIAVDEFNVVDVWYVPKKFFESNYRR